MKYAGLCCYYGQLPNYFEFWLESAKKNFKMDFFIITDKTTIEGYYDDLQKIQNIHVIYISFNDLKYRIQQFFDFEITLNSPYKLCDYRLTFGLVFKEILLDFDYFGWYDIDVILGDLNQLLYHNDDKPYDVIGINGHFTLLRNKKEFIYLFLESINKTNQASSYKKVFSSNHSCFFDEDYGLRKLIERFNFLDLRPYIADINFWKEDFYCDLSKDAVFIKRDTINNKLYACDEIKEYEIIYAHFQKRTFKIETEVLDSYCIIPNKFTQNKDYVYNGKCRNGYFFKYYRDSMIARRINLSTNFFLALKNKISKIKLKDN